MKKIITYVIIAVPDYAKKLLADYCQKISTEAWDKYIRRSTKSKSVI